MIKDFIILAAIFLELVVIAAITTAFLAGASTLLGNLLWAL